MLICTIMYAVAPLPAETGGNLGKGLEKGGFLQSGAPSSV